MSQISPHKITNTFSLSRATRALRGGHARRSPLAPFLAMQHTRHSARARENAHTHERAQGWLRL